jgi:EAL domain-containing protein (putative c-di-GMP-specific phosphodiesterase class I)/ActR/RegA family two-component response regulator
MNQAMIIDDDEDYRNLLVRKLCRSYPSIKVHEIDPLTMSLPDETYSWDEIDFIILDYQLGIDYTGLDWFKRFKPENMPATILLTARGSEELAVKAIKLGIDDYIVKEHFDNDTLNDSINECVYNKKRERATMLDLTSRSAVFNKSSFIHRLEYITNDKDTRHHLFLFNPDAYQRLGREKGLNAQDKYIGYIADLIYRYFTSHHVECNIFIYREEYIAAIIEAHAYKKQINDIYKMLEGEIFKFGGRSYPCSSSIGVISPRSLESDKVKMSDFELLSIAQVLCNSAKTKEKKRICNYGDVNMKDSGFSGGESLVMDTFQSFDIDQTIADGRITANYQPWIYISTDETINLKDIYDVRIEVIDTEGNKLGQRELLGILDDPYAKRAVDRWVLRNSATQLRKLADTSGKHDNIKLAVKITLSSVADPQFIPWLQELLTDADLPAGSLFFEIEAHHFIRDPEQYLMLTEEIGNRYDVKLILSGIHQIDTYYHVRDIQRFNYVKLNVKDLIYGFPRNPLYNLINTIKDDKTKIVAVNVADAETLTLVTEFDIDYVHGYLVGRPYIDVISDGDGDLYCVI